MSLFRSEDNLESGTIQFVESNAEITLYCAYIRTSELEKINTSKKIKSIVVRWEIEDLCKGASDPDLYDYCRENSIALYRNTRLHMKAFWNNANSVFFGSANVTKRGLGEAGSICNLELNGIQENLGFKDYIYFNDVLSSAEYITDELFAMITSLVESVELPASQFPSLPTVTKEIDHFLISQLPMSSSPVRLFEIYTDGTNDILELNCAAHDLSIYNIKQGLDQNTFMQQLRITFNEHPFISKFKAAVENSNSGREDRKGTMNFGQVRRWFAENTTTVPTPRPWDLNENVQILYEWICYFDDRFEWSVPGARTQVIKFCGN